MAGVERHLQPLGFVRARKVPGARATTFARWVGTCWQALDVDCVSWHISCLLCVSHLEHALLWLRMMEHVGKPQGPNHPASSFSAWLKKVHDGPLKGAPTTGGVPFHWRFDEDVDTEATAVDISSVFSAVGPEIFERTSTPESTRTFLLEHPDRCRLSYNDRPMLAALLRDVATVDAWPLGKANPAMAAFLHDCAVNGLPDLGDEIPKLAAGATLDGVPNPFPPAPLKQKKSRSTKTNGSG